MQYRPGADQLLDTIAELIGTELLPALPVELQHRARVAANLAQIVACEVRQAPAARGREHDAMAALLGHDGDGDELRAELARRLRADEGTGFEAAAWAVLVAVARDDLAIAKPGYDAWEGQ